MFGYGTSTSVVVRSAGLQEVGVSGGPEEDHTKYVHRDGLFPRRDLKAQPSGYEAGVPTSRQPGACGTVLLSVRGPYECSRGC